MIEVPFVLCEEDLKDEERLCQKLMDLASIVCSRHFYTNTGEREDLISVGVLKALSMIREGNWDPKKGNIVTFLYTGIRNEMHNYIYRISREVLLDNEFLLYSGDEALDGHYDLSFLEVEYEVVADVCKEFFRFYGDLSDRVAERMEKKGFRVKGYKGNNISLVAGDFDDKFYDDLIDRLSGAVLWRIQGYCH